MSTTKFKIESGVQLLTRLSKKPIVENFYPPLFQSGPKTGDIIEVFGDCGTTQLITDLITTGLIQTRLNGLPAGVLICNTDGHINFCELIEVLHRKLSSIYGDKDELEKIVCETMSNIHVLNIYDATQFYVTIQNFESILLEHPNISIIVFDTLTSFYWSEQGFKIMKMDLYTKNLINLIQKVTREYKTICIYTRPEYFCSNKDLEILPTNINYQIQILENGNNKFQVNIKAINSKVTRVFRVLNGDINWV